METFTAKFAGIPVGICALFRETRDFCEEYLTEECPTFSVEIFPADIAAERIMSDETTTREYGKPIPFPDPYLETLAVYRKIADHMLNYDTMLFHGSVIAVDGAAYLFTAPSGTGKSTHTRLWRELFGERAHMVNDDKPLLKVTENGVWACGTPWDGKHHLSRNEMVPLKAICILERAAENHIEPVNVKDSLSRIFTQTYRPKNPEGMIKTMALLDRMLRQVKVYRLGCNMELEAAKTAYAGMQGT